MKYEKESMTDSPKEAGDILEQFKAQGKWQVSTFSRTPSLCFISCPQIQDTSFNDEVTLTRKFGNEK